MGCHCCYQFTLHSQLVATINPPVSMTEPDYFPPADTGLDIIYQDDALFVLNKPAGLLSVPGRGANKQDSLISRVQKEYPEALIVHRLDMATSGLIILARNELVHRAMGQLFEQRQVEKKYLAIVDGKPANTTGEIDLPLITDWPNRPKQKVDHVDGKHALTRYRVLDYLHDQAVSRIELRPVTGRTHQLRVHMWALGHAICGDRLYATDHVRDKSDRLLLHATCLKFIHPMDKTELELNSPPPF